MRHITKFLAAAAIVSVAAGSALAGGLAGEVVEAEPIEAAEPAGSLGGAVLPLALLVVFAAAAAGGGSSDGTTSD